MNNSYLYWLRCAPPLLAPHTLFVVVLFSSCESAQHFASPCTRIQTKRNFGCLQLRKRRLNSLLYLYDCNGKITPLPAFAWTKSVIIAKNGFAFNKSVTKEPHSSLKWTSCSSKLCSCSADHLLNIFLTTWQQRSRDERKRVHRLKKINK